MSDKHYIGKNLFSFSDNGLRAPVSRVTLMLDSENAITAGDDTGIELVAECPYASETLVLSLLEKAKGYQYHAFDAQSADIDPAAELGDGVTAGGIYSLLASLSDSGNGYPDLSAPGNREEEDEYPEGGYVTKVFNRKLAQTRSLISKNSEEIKLRITSKEAETLIGTALGKIELSIKAADGTTTAIKLSEGGTIDLSGLVTFESLKEGGTTEIDGSRIKTGTISADRIDVESLKVKTIWGSATRKAIVCDASNIYIGGDENMLNFSKVFLRGGEVTFSCWGSSVFEMTYDSVLGQLYPEGANKISIGTASKPFADVYSKNLTVGAGTIKIGANATSALLGFYGATPVIRQTLATSSNNMGYTSATASNYLYILNNVVGILKKLGLIG